MSLAPLSLATAHQRITQLAALTSVHRAFSWLHLQQQRLRDWQIDLIRIPAPPFGEAARAEWMCDRFRDLGLYNIHIDSEGNALSFLREPTEDEPLILLSAHIDTVFPAETDFEPRIDGTILRAPGSCDNAAGVTALLAIAAALTHAQISPTCNILFAANVGEEAEGDLRGMRHLFHRSAYARHISAAIALEGSGTETVVTRGLGSKRFRVTLRGAGGHSWTDAATPNPIATLARAISRLYEAELPRTPRTTINVGTISGGSGVTAVPQLAQADFDLRSVNADELVRCEVLLFRAVEDAVIEANADAAKDAAISFIIEPTGNRPAADLPQNSPLLESVHAVDRHLSIRTEQRIGSTDANLPLALGIPAIAIGAGGTGGGIHTTDEWYDTRNRELALRRVLLVLLDVCEWG